MWYFIFLCASYICLADSSLAPFITKCKHDDTKCLTETMRTTIPLFADGIPDLNVQKLDPLKLKHIDATTANLKLIISDAVLTGLRNCEAKKLSRDVEKSQLAVELLCTCELEGKYDMDGKLFVVPIKGNGDLHAVIRKILINVEADIVEEDGKENKKHWRVKSWRHNFTLNDKSDVDFQNLFPDNEVLRQTATELITNNGNDVVLEIGQPVIKAVAGKVVRRIQNFLEAVPLEDLVLD
ncbi:unnamed protein product [Arctia plantaginis]|uniref:Uncharacterized protein n=1 Tax=Arctia plantaginis TaxID=874455 RepID=A0A8S1B0M6_ARCPL|nr:unnamed protein product [Arctia plantaginis]